MRLNISVPDDLAQQARARNLPISSICQDALRVAVNADPSQRMGLAELIADVVREEARKVLRHELGKATWGRR